MTYVSSVVTIIISLGMDPSDYLLVFGVPAFPVPLQAQVLGLPLGNHGLLQALWFASVAIGLGTWCFGSRPLCGHGTQRETG